MKLYSVDFVRYYNYVVEAEDKEKAYDRAIRIHQLATENARIDDAMVTRIDETGRRIEED